LARIGEVIISSPNVGLVYDSFAREAGRLIDFSPHAILIHWARVVLYVNRATADLLGLSDSDDLIGVDIVDFVELDYRGLFDDRLRGLQRT
jgi:PAS domain-containing protein